MIKSKNVILILAAVLLVGAIAYFAFANAVKSGADASAGRDAQNPAGIAIATPVQETTIIANTDWQKKLDTDIQNPNYEYKASIEHLRVKIKLLFQRLRQE